MHKSITFSWIRCGVVAGLLVAGLVLRCGPPEPLQIHVPERPLETNKEPRPEPGAMQVVSTTPLKLAPSSGLFGNGDFAQWPPLQPAPEGFRAPELSTKCSVIEPEVERTVSPPIAVRQTWTRNDSHVNFFTTFRAWVQGLKPDTQYTFRAQANNLSQNTILIIAHEFYVAKPVEANQLPLGNRLFILEIPPGEGFKEYTTDFTTGKEPKICGMFFTECRKGGEDFPATVIWDDWYLDVAKKTSEPKAAPEAEPKAAPEAEPKAAPEAEPKAAPEAEPKAAPEAEPKAAPEAEPKAAPEAEPKGEAKGEPEAESESSAEASPAP